MFSSHFLRKFEYARLASAVLWSSSFFAYLRVVRLCVWNDIDECERHGFALPTTTSQCGHLLYDVNVQQSDYDSNSRRCGVRVGRAICKRKC
jgi:hypothetical protein